jgi:rubrerythrin
MKVGEVLQTALDFEQQGRDYYLRASDQVEDSVAQSILISLANDEHAHAGMIRRFYKILQKQRGWPAAEGTLGGEESAAMRDILDKTIGKLGGESDYQKIYQTARQMELQSRDFYKKQAGPSGDPDLMKFLQFLAEVEQTHLEALEMLLWSIKGAS